jgi:hypothetical protein
MDEPRRLGKLKVIIFLSVMSPDQRIFLNIVAAYGRSLCALACERFIGRWAGGGWDERAGDSKRGGMMVVEVKF